jgi:hypothetical protein
MTINIKTNNKMAGLFVGGVVGALTGAVAGISMVIELSYTLPAAFLVLVTFMTIIAPIGGFIGMLFDIDARERGVVQPSRTRIKIRPAVQRGKTQPLTVPSIN